jgi:hypothetical protein
VIWGPCCLPGASHLPVITVLYGAHHPELWSLPSRHSRSCGWGTACKQAVTILWQVTGVDSTASTNQSAIWRKDTESIPKWGWCLFFSFLTVCTQGLTLTRQLLYHWSYTASTLIFFF